MMDLRFRFRKFFENCCIDLRTRNSNSSNRFIKSCNAASIPMKVKTEIFNDGHKPGATHVSTKMAFYEGKASEEFVSVFDDVLPKEWCDKAYEYMRNRRKPWGVYVETDMVKDSNIQPSDLYVTSPELAIGLAATRALVFEKGSSVIGADHNNIDGTVVWCLLSDVNDVVEYHIDYAELYRYETNVIYPPLYGGVMHLTPFVFEDKDTDEDNKLCTSESEAESGEGEVMTGGDFLVNMRGLKHYAEYGYKGMMKPASDLMEEMANADVVSSSFYKAPADADASSTASPWQCIRYKHNRGVIMDGNLPHMATTVTSIRKVQLTNGGGIASTPVPPAAGSGNVQATPPPAPNTDSGSHTHQRVILGFNCFPAETGECCRRAPEHSDAFNRTVKLYQTLSSMGVPVSAASVQETERGCTSTEEPTLGAKYGSNGDSPNPGDQAATKKKALGTKISAKEIMKNPGLAKMLVFAAKKVKAEEKAKVDKLAAAASDKDAGVMHSL